jgi:hypothetical protein
MAFILHNVEECRSFEEFKTFYLKKINPKLCRWKVFLYALIILTLIVSGISIANYWTASRALGYATTIIAISLLIRCPLYQFLVQLSLRKMEYSLQKEDLLN